MFNLGYCICPFELLTSSIAPPTSILLSSISSGAGDHVVPLVPSSNLNSVTAKLAAPTADSILGVEDIFTAVAGAVKA